MVALRKGRTIYDSIGFLQTKGVPLSGRLQYTEKKEPKWRAVSPDKKKVENDAQLENIKESHFQNDSLFFKRGPFWLSFNLNRHRPKTRTKAFLGSFRTPEYCLLSHLCNENNQDDFNGTSLEEPILGK